MNSISNYLLIISIATYSVATSDLAVRSKRCTCMQPACSCISVAITFEMQCSCPQVQQPCICGEQPQPCVPQCQEVCQRQCVGTQCRPVCWKTCSSTCQPPRPPVPVIPHTVPTLPPTIPTIPPTLPPVTFPPMPQPQPCCQPMVPTVQCIQIMYMQCYCTSGYGPCGNGSQCCKKR